jgi:Zn-dependent protease with chaperone function
LDNESLGPPNPGAAAAIPSLFLRASVNPMTIRRANANRETLVLSSVLCLLALGSANRGPAAERTYPAYVTQHDLMTDLDALYLNYLNPDPALKTVEEWPIVGQILKISTNIVDAGIIADRLNQSLPVDDQPAFRPVKAMVDECAQRLGVKPPHLFIESNPHVNAYVTRLKEPHLLVLTSGLYDLFKDRPDELRFIIGHELGHLRCNHIRCHLVGSALVDFIVGDEPTGGIAEDFLAHLLVGQLLAWYRESEFSADRAGLVCVGGDLDVAKRALLRLLHGTKEDVLPEVAVREQIAFEKEPFVKIVRRLRALRSRHPFVPDRVHALDQWTTTDSYQLLMQRREKAPPNRFLVIDEIQITGLPDTDIGFGTASDPLIRLVVGDKAFESGRFSNNNNPHLTDLAWKTSFAPGEFRGIPGEFRGQDR